MIGGEGEKGGQEAARWGVSENKKTCAKPSSKRKRKSAHLPLLAADGAKGGNQPTQAYTWPVLHTLGRKGGGKEGAGGLPFLNSIARASMQKARNRAAPPRRRAQWLKAFLFWDVALPARPLPLPHVVQVRDTWRRGPIGSFKPRRGTVGEEASWGKGRRGQKTMAG